MLQVSKSHRSMDERSIQDKTTGNVGSALKDEYGTHVNKSDAVSSDMKMEMLNIDKKNISQDIPKSVDEDKTYENCNEIHKEVKRENNLEHSFQSYDSSGDGILNSHLEQNSDVEGTHKSWNEAQESDLLLKHKDLYTVNESLRCSGQFLDQGNGKKKHTASSKPDDFSSPQLNSENNRKKSSSPTEEFCEENKSLNSKGSICSDPDTICGLGAFRPQWMQSYATPKSFLILYAISGILHGSYHSYVIGTFSTLEKRFAFGSKISGVIMITDEAVPLFLGSVIGYYAGKVNRSRMMAFGMFLSAACSIFSALPYFIYGPEKHLTFQNVENHRGPEYCDPLLGIESCETGDRPQTLPAVLLFVFGSFLKGFGNLAAYAIGMAYMDDNSNKKSTPLYLGIVMALKFLGPFVGYLMSSAFLKINENPVDNPDFGPEDPRWIGAWWMGFVLQGILMATVSFPLACFPRRLPGRKKMEQATSAANEGSFWKNVLGLFSALKRLGRNPFFITLIISDAMKICGHFGHAIMLPKYMENQFRLSSSEASLFSGVASLACIMLTCALGGIITWKFRPTIKVVLVGMIIAEIISCIGFLVLMIPRCQTVDMMQFGIDEEGYILNGNCNEHCDCSTTSFAPFCGPGGKTTYFSPCYAGCTQQINSSFSSENHKIFGDCSCVADDGQQQMEAVISEGFCTDDSCWNQTLAYLIIYFIIIITNHFFIVPNDILFLRSVHPSDKNVALGTIESFSCLFALIPLPITYGALVDSACLVWDKSCGETGNCWFYDTDKFCHLLHGAAAFFCALATASLTVMYRFSSRVRDLYEEEKEGEQVADSADLKLDTLP